MPYLGNIPATQFAELKYQDFTGGSGTSFTLNDPVGSAQELEVFVNNVRQEPGVAYTVSGTGLTMTGSIASTDDFYVVFQGKSTGTATHPAGQALTATDGTFTSSFTSPGIDDNASSTAMTLDSSGNVLVGKTATGLSTTGFQAIATGNQSAFISDGDRALILNRQTSDGSVLEFRKDGSIVGTIATVSDDLNIFSNTANHTGLRFALNAVLPTNTNGSVVDDAVDLGKSSANYRFKDLYLSGGAFIGGTGSANKLEDYEEGTFTPVAEGETSAGSGSYMYQVGSYVKVGSLVLFQANIQFTSHSGSGVFRLSGLPFTAKNTTNLFAVAAGYLNGLPVASNHRAMPFVRPNTTYVNINQENGSGGASSVSIDAAAQVLITGSYRTDA